MNSSLAQAQYFRYPKTPSSSYGPNLSKADVHGYSGSQQATPWKLNIAPDLLPSQKAWLVVQSSFFKDYGYWLLEADLTCFTRISLKFFKKNTGIALPNLQYPFRYKIHPDSFCFCNCDPKFGHPKSKKSSGAPTLRFVHVFNS